MAPSEPAIHPAARSGIFSAPAAGGADGATFAVAGVDCVNPGIGETTDDIFATGSTAGGAALGRDWMSFKIFTWFAAVRTISGLPW